tara:strand:+ start:575 stop:1933 length:1359 start_codon:yes stop_codon:yes gene_type:complete
MWLLFKKKFIKLLKYIFETTFPEYVKVKISYLLDPLPKNRLRATVSIRAENYFQACKEELKKKDKNSKHHYLHTAFKKHLVRSSLIDDNWWSDFIKLIDLPDGAEFEQINKSLIDRIEDYNFNSLEHFEILDIYSLCIRFSLYDLGFYLRQKSLRIALDYPLPLKDNESWKLKTKLSALLEIGNFNEFDQLLPLFASRKNKEIYFLKYLREVLGNSKTSEFKSSIIIKDSEQDLNFSKFIENKKIVIVSPSPVNIKDGIKIDNADVVVRTNYKPGETLIKGNRCDVNYVNLHKALDVEKNGYPDWSLDTKWLIVKGWNYIEIILNKLSSDGISIKNLNFRAIEKFDNALFYGNLLVLPHIIIDLLRRNPKEIYLYHFDAMLSLRRISGYFPKNTKDEKSALIKGNVGHDPVINFIILKSFWMKGFIKGDHILEKVMKMEIEDYMKKLQKNYR